MFKTIPFSIINTDFHIINFEIWKDFVFVLDVRKNIILYSENKTSWNVFYNSQNKIFNFLIWKDYLVIFEKKNIIYLSLSKQNSPLQQNTFNILTDSNIVFSVVYKDLIYLYDQTRSIIGFLSENKIQISKNFLGIKVLDIMTYNDFLFVVSDKGVYYFDGNEWGFINPEMNSLFSYRNVDIDTGIVRDGKNASYYNSVYPFEHEELFSSFAYIDGDFYYGGDSKGTLLTEKRNLDKFFEIKKEERIIDSDQIPRINTEKKLLFRNGDGKITFIKKIKNAILFGCSNKLFVYFENKINLISEIHNENFVSCAVYDDTSFLVGTDNGRILNFINIPYDGSLTGNKKVIVSLENSVFQKFSFDEINFVYFVNNFVFKVANNITKHISIDANSVISKSENCGRYISPPVRGSSSLTNWKALVLNLDVLPEVNSKLNVYLRSGKDIESLLSSTWDINFDISLDSTESIHSLSEYCLEKEYIQYRVETCGSNISISNISFLFGDLKSSYFYTQPISILNASQGFLMVEAGNAFQTDIKCAYGPTDAVSWNDMTECPLNSIFELPKDENIKIGIKLISYTDMQEEIDNIAFMFAGGLSNV